MNATSMSVRSALIAACASAALSQKERSALMTPTNPITEAREALDYIAENFSEDVSDEVYEKADAGYEAIRAALDHAEIQAAEIERLKAEVETQRKELSEYRSSTAYSDLYHEAQGLAAERDSLKAKLAKAEEVIKPFAEAAESLTGSEDDDAIIAPAFMDSPPLGECDLVVCCVADLRAAAQFTKEREGL